MPEAPTTPEVLIQEPQQVVAPPVVQAVPAVTSVPVMEQAPVLAPVTEDTGTSGNKFLF